LSWAKPGDRGARGHLVAVDLAQDVLRERLLLGTVLLVVPVEVLDGQSFCVRRVGVVRPDPLGEVVDEPQLAAGVARRLERLVAPLHEPLGVREGALLLDVGSRRA
jgi:hypothetical protein